MVTWKRGNVLFNDTLNTLFYGYFASDIIMVKDHSDSERGNPPPPHGLFFLTLLHCYRNK